jgi:hypothetical protein
VVSSLFHVFSLHLFSPTQPTCAQPIRPAFSLVYPTSPSTLDTNPPFRHKAETCGDNSNGLLHAGPARFTTPLGCCEEARSGAAACLVSRLFIQWRRRNRRAGHVFALPVCLSLAAAVSSSSVCKVRRRPSHKLQAGVE